MHNLITERTPQQRLGGVGTREWFVLAAYRSDKYLRHVRCSSQSQILVRNGVFGGYGRALTQNDGRSK